MYLIGLFAVTLLAVGILEKRRHQARLHNIPFRIHISGTRGKSLLVRMATDLFQQAGWAVAARVTGEEPMVFTPGKGWLPWWRRVPARIKEQMRFIRVATRESAPVVVVENMALRPENQYAAEAHMIRSTLSVFTNFHPDHQEVMGPADEDAAAALAFSFPKNGTVLLPEQEATPAIHARMNELGNRLVTVRSSPEIPATSHQIFGPHFSILKEIQKRFELPDKVFKQVAAEWQQRLRPENFLLPLPGVAKRYFVDLFSCNDVTSARQIVTWLEEMGSIHPPYDTILACRADRPLRTRAFLEWLLPELGEGRVVLAGSCPLLLIRHLRRRFGVPAKASPIFTKIVPERIFHELADSTNTVFGLGNYVGSGEKILSYLKKD